MKCRTSRNVWQAGAILHCLFPADRRSCLDFVVHQLQFPGQAVSQYLNVRTLPYLCASHAATKVSIQSSLEKLPVFCFVVEVLTATYVTNLGVKELIFTSKSHFRSEFSILNTRNVHLQPSFSSIFTAWTPVVQKWVRPVRP